MRSWARRLARDHDDLAPAALATAVGRRVLEELAPSLRRSRPPSSALDVHGAPPGGWADPWLPGLVHEQAVSAVERSGRGAWYTPEPVVRGLVAIALPAANPPPGLVVDPTCGGGAFLLAALDRLLAIGVDPSEALGRIAGMDIDPDAAAVSRMALRLWAVANGLGAPPVPGAPADDRGGEAAGRTIESAVRPDVDRLVMEAVVVGDALVECPERWPELRVTVGNPPFATPLRSGAVPPSAIAYREARRDLLGPYSDLAAHHLLRAVETSGPGSTVALILPQSVLAGRDTEGLRRHLDETAPLHDLWAAREAVFDAGVRACAVVVRPGASSPQRIGLTAGPFVDRRPSSGPSSWGRLAARALGAPALPPTMQAGRAGASRRLGELVAATAGFRDEYYGLVAACREWTGPAGREPNRLMTVGSVEPLASQWGSAPTKLGGRRWSRPYIDEAGLPEKVARWWKRQARPKLVVATQSKLLEPLIDGDGSVVPATPLISVHADPDDLASVAAVLLAPPVVAWAWERWFGTALTVDGLKLAARQIAELPLPVDETAWAEAAARIEVHLAGVAGDEAVVSGWRVACEVAEIMTEAYGADADVFEWWYRRGEPGRGDVRRVPSKR